MNKKTKLIAVIGVMSALSFILYSLEISIGFILPQAAFLKIDFSDIPVFLTTLISGPFAGITVAFIKNLLHISITKEIAFSGEIANFLCSAAFLLPLSIREKSRKKLRIPVLCLSVICTVVVMAFANYFITLPLYGIDKQLRIPMILSTFIPFNAIRGVILAVVLYLLYPSVKNIANKL